MTVAQCIDSLQHGYGLDVGPAGIGFAKAQIASGRSLLATRRADGRETHFVDMHGQPVLAVWDAARELVVTFLRVNAEPDRLHAFIKGMRASARRAATMDTIAAIKAAPQLEHDRLVAQAREEGGWTGQMIAAWAGVCARDNALAIDCPFTDDEPELANRWRTAHGQGRDAPAPTAQVTPLPKTPWLPRHGTTHAARCAPQD